MVLLLEYKKFFEKFFINHLTNEKICDIIKSQKAKGNSPEPKFQSQEKNLKKISKTT